jgi:hypothetical protein
MCRVVRSGTAAAHLRGAPRALAGVRDPLKTPIAPPWRRDARSLLVGSVLLALDLEQRVAAALRKSSSRMLIAICSLFITVVSYTRAS